MSAQMFLVPFAPTLVFRATSITARAVARMSYATGEGQVTQTNSRVRVLLDRGSSRKPLSSSTQHLNRSRGRLITATLMWTSPNSWWQFQNREAAGIRQLKRVLLQWGLDLLQVLRMDPARSISSKGNLFWKAVRDVITTPGKEQVECQSPKPILLDTGEMKVPYDWAPSILPVQILRVGQFVILSVPSEFTTMAGRRLRDAVKTILTSSRDSDLDAGLHVVIAGLTNTYSQYVTTFEEYQVQRYEGASTLYGPHTLSAYIQEFTKLANSLLHGQATEAGPQPPDLLNKQLSFLTPVVVDIAPAGVEFGDCSSDVPKNSTFKRGDKVEATFWTACPRNDLMTEATFALVEMMVKTWVSVYDDDDFCLRYKWTRPAKLSPSSLATIEWRIPDSAPSGVYRIRHFGAAKALFGSVRYFTGSSSAFVVA